MTSWDEGLARRAPAGWTVAPGFVDLQVNGYAGAEVADRPDEIEAIARALPAAGVTAWCPTLVTRSDAAYRRAAVALEAVRWPAVGARNLGVHLEGPFLNPLRAGAHPAERMRPPEPRTVDRLLTMFSPRIMTLAPELPGALDAITHVAAQGVTVAVGHTEAGARETWAAIDRGARLLTHAFNAMPGMTAREPGPVGAFLAHPAAHVSLIADGVHVASELCALVARGAGKRLVLVSDATAATGAGEGRYRLGERSITSAGGAVTTGGALAGGTVPLWRGVAGLIQWGVPRTAALRAATTAPARLLGIPSAALRGDRVLLDENLAPRLTLVGGTVAYAAPDLPFDVPEVGYPFTS